MDYESYWIWNSKNSFGYLNFNNWKKVRPSLEAMVALAENTKMQTKGKLKGEKYNESLNKVWTVGGILLQVEHVDLPPLHSDVCGISFRGQRFKYASVRIMPNCCQKFRSTSVTMKQTGWKRETPNLLNGKKDNSYGTLKANCWPELLYMLWEQPQPLVHSDFLRHVSNNWASVWGCGTCVVDLERKRKVEI